MGLSREAEKGLWLSDNRPFLGGLIIVHYSFGGTSRFANTAQMALIGGVTDISLPQMTGLSTCSLARGSAGKELLSGHKS